jgi:hypothetical protein
MKSTRQTMKEKPCYLYIDEEPITSYRDVIKKFHPKKSQKKKRLLKKYWEVWSTTTTTPKI